MSEHLSEFALDRVAAELPVEAEVTEHLASCAACRDRVEALVAENRRLRAEPAFRSVEARLVRGARRRTLSRALAGLGVATAATLVVWLVRPGPATVGAPEPGAEPSPSGAAVRAKSPPLAVVPVAGTRKGSGGWRPGDRVALSVAAGVGSYGLVMGVDPQGEVSLVWPPEGRRSGALRAGGGKLQPAFAVTPGDLLLVAWFTAEPVPVEVARTALEEAVRACRAPDGIEECARRARVLDVVAPTTVTLRVEGVR